MARTATPAARDAESGIQYIILLCSQCDQCILTNSNPVRRCYLLLQSAVLYLYT